jgi:hypothetical protein
MKLKRTVVKAQLIKEIVPGAMGNSIDNPEDRDWKRLMFYARHP